VVVVKFWKMHGLGNDFIVIDNRAERISENETNMTALKLCERRFGVGADGLLLLYESETADAKMRIFNSDGGEAEMCGNGIRCFAKYCYEEGVSKKRELSIETLAGLKRAWLTVQDGEVKKVKTDMGEPLLKRSDIPMLGKGTCINEDLVVGKRKYKITCLSMGNPHCVIFVNDVKSFPVKIIGPEIERHKVFPNRINAEFVQILKRDEILARVWERGCGETFACGTGACASVVAGNLLNKMNGRVTVHLLGGDLEIEYSNKVLMTGPAKKVFKGEFLYT
jgi:diaminopimelate epimerase